MSLNIYYLIILLNLKEIENDCKPLGWLPSVRETKGRYSKYGISK